MQHHTVVEGCTDEWVTPAVAPGYVLRSPKKHVQRKLGVANLADFQDLLQGSPFEGHHHQHIGIRLQPGCSSCHRAEQNHPLRGERLHQAVGEGLEGFLSDERWLSHGSIITGYARAITFGQAHCRFRALLGGSRRELESQLDQSFPFLPPGCRLALDRVSQQAVLASLRASLPTRRPALLGELRALAS